MNKLSESLPSSATTGFNRPALPPSSAIGTPLGEIGSGKPLPVSASLAAMDPAEVDDQMIAALQRMQGRAPVLRQRIMFPETGPTYSVVASVEWECSADRLPEAAVIVGYAFRSAPGGSLAKALFRLRTLTRGRDQRSAADHEGEADIWLEQLRCYPGDIALATLRDWPSRKPDGQWWPTWHDVESELKRRIDSRLAIANFVRSLMTGRPTALMIAAQTMPETAEQRERAVERWEREIRPEMAAHGAPPRPKETPEQALQRLREARDAPVVIGEGLAALLASLAAERASP